ncbi:MAG: ATP-binding protein [Gemmatimonadota bacterium]
MTLPTLLAWSGGKDSSLALAALRADSSVRVVGLLTTVAPAYDRVSIHGVRRSILHAQAAALDVPVFEASLTPSSSNAQYDAAWATALSHAQAAVGPVVRIAYGDLFLEDVRRFREEQAIRLGYTPVFPLWGENTSALARRFIRAGYEAYLTCVDTTQLDASFAGRRFDDQLLVDLPPEVDPCGERGEFHTCVVAGPLFRRRIEVTVGARVRRDERFEYCDLVPAPPAVSTGVPA